MVVHIQSTLTKRDDLTKEQFDKQCVSSHSSSLEPTNRSITSWLAHGDLFMKNPLAKAHILRYTQSHFGEASNKQFEATGLQAPKSFDGIANFWFEKIEDAHVVFQSEYYRDIIVPDEERMVKRDQTSIFVTEDVEYWNREVSGTK